MSDYSPLRPSVVRPDNVPEMVERVARALAAQSFEALGNDKAGAGATAAECRWPHFVPQAYTAIEAMREPDEAMKNAVEHTGMMWVWSACIDIALSSKGSGGGERSSSETNQNPSESNP